MLQVWAKMEEVGSEGDGGSQGTFGGNSVLSIRGSQDLSRSCRHIGIPRSCTAQDKPCSWGGWGITQRPLDFASAILVRSQSSMSRRSTPYAVRRHQAGRQ